MKQLILLLALLVVGCPQQGLEPRPEPKDTDKCGNAEKTLERLQCKDRAGDPMWVNKNGERFEETCHIAQQDGRVFLNPACVAAATTCEGAKQCPGEGS